MSRGWKTEMRGGNGVNAVKYRDVNGAGRTTLKSIIAASIQEARYSVPCR